MNSFDEIHRSISQNKGPSDSPSFIIYSQEEQYSFPKYPVCSSGERITDASELCLKNSNMKTRKEVRFFLGFFFFCNDLDKIEPKSFGLFLVKLIKASAK